MRVSSCPIPGCTTTGSIYAGTWLQGRKWWTHNVCRAGSAIQGGLHIVFRMVAADLSRSHFSESGRDRQIYSMLVFLLEIQISSGNSQNRTPYLKACNFIVTMHGNTS